jgi:RNA polymerase sigma-70 factor (ECF subfamily)
MDEAISHNSYMVDSPIIDPGNKRNQFAAIALPFTRPLYNAARRLAYTHEDASDLVQETYLRAYRTFDNFTLGTNCKAWLFTILYSIFVNKYRKEQREPEAVSAEELEERFDRCLAGAWDPQQLLILEQVGTEVDQALNRLPETFRSVVLLVDVEEMSYEETAAVLSCPVGTVRSRLYRARKLLFTELQQYALLQGYGKKAKRQHATGDPTF